MTSQDGTSPEIDTRRAEAYQEFLVPAIFGPWTGVLVEKAGLQPGEAVLDVACGTGVVSRIAAERVGDAGRVVGLDLDPGMLEVAKRNTPLPVDWELGDAQAMPFGDGEFDAALCQQGFQFLPDRVAGLREIRRVLRPGGRFAASVWSGFENNPGFEALHAAQLRHINPAAPTPVSLSLTDPAVICSLLEGAGFREISLETISRASRFPSAGAFVEAVAAGGPALGRAIAELKPEGREAFMKDVAASLAAYAGSGGLEVPFESYIFLART
ncbi:MAG: methyltransferase domain-containing protein [bacterium]|nr:methyltransferase domain-containing protein [bacterium]